MRTNKLINQFYRYVPVYVLLATLSGCGPAVNGIITGGNSYSIDRSHQKTDSDFESYLLKVKKLSDSGDADGKFLWTQANDEKLTKQPIVDSELLMSMYMDASRRGSLDASFQVLIYDIRAAAYHLKRNPSNRNDLTVKLNLNLNELGKILEQRCWIRKPFVIPGRGGICLGGVSVASRIWPALRDTADFPDKAETVERWRTSDLMCKESPRFKAINIGCL